MENTIRECFFIYTNFLRQTIKNVYNYDHTTMSIGQIRNQIDILHMGFIVHSSYTIAENSPAVIAYKQLITMIESFQERNIREKYEELLVQHNRLKIELDSLKDKPKVETPKSGWIFSS